MTTETKEALVIIDVQRDFLPGGPMGVPGGDDVIPVINRMMNDFPLVAATRDWHPPDHGSFAANHPGAEPFSMGELDGLPQVMWPVHCVQESEGAEFPDEFRTGGIDQVFAKGERPEVDSYSGFYDNGHRFATGLGDWLRERGVEAVTVCGLATDYCVKFTALDAVREGLRTRVDLRACRGVDLNEGDVAAAVDEMRDAGVEVTGG